MTTMFSMDTIKSRLPAWKSSSKAGFDKSYAVGKKGFDKGWKALDKLGNPVNRLSNKLGSEAFWPMTLDKESEKAARILKAFLGGIEEEIVPGTEKKEGIPQGTQRVTKHIPREVIANAKAIAIFTACRTGFWVSSSGGSGILIRRLPTTPAIAPADLTEDAFDEAKRPQATSHYDPNFDDISLDDKSPRRNDKHEERVWFESQDNRAASQHEYMTPPSTPPSGSSPPPLPPRSAQRASAPPLPPRVNSSLLFDSSVPHHEEKHDYMEKPRWSPPSGILLHTAALGFLAGVDIYDCVMILNTEAAVEAFTNPRLTLGAEVSVAAGPYSIGGVLDQNLKYQKAKQLRNLTGKKSTEERDTTENGEEEEKIERKSTGFADSVKEQRPVWSYMKSRGLYFGLGQLDGSIVIERTDENAEFYGVEGVKVTDILCGDITVPLLPPKPDEIDDDDDIGEQKGVKALWDVLETAGIGEKEITWQEIDAAREKAKMKAAEKDKAEVGTARSGRVMNGAKTIVVPQRPSTEDDDPYGVRALERTGMQLFEAGSHRRVSSIDFGAMFPPTPLTPPARRPSTATNSSRSEVGFVDVPLRHEKAIKRAEETIREWEKQAETNRRRREKRMSDSEIFDKIQNSKMDFDFDKIKRRSTYS